MPYGRTNQSCDIKTTPLRLANANIAVLYVALAVVAFVLFWIANSIKSYDPNVYALRNQYNGSQVVPPAFVSVVTSATTSSLYLVLTFLFIFCAIMHVVYALDCRRMYTILLIDRCNFMRWIQFAVLNALIGAVVAHLLGTESIDFFTAMFFFMPVAGIMGYFSEKSYPCCPGGFWVAYLALLLGMIGAYWSPVLWNFTTHIADSQYHIPAYLYVILSAMVIFHLVMFAMPYIQMKCRMYYASIELGYSISMLLISAAVLGLMGWASVY